MRTVQTEFPDFDDDLQAILARLGGDWEDNSWHNDSCPSLFSAERDLVCYVDYLDAAKREFEAALRFSLSHADTGKVLVESNEFQDVIDYLLREG
jgi:hypothetical protein